MHPESSIEWPTSRRDAIFRGACMAFASLTLGYLVPARHANALPLAPLGNVKRVGGEKLLGLSDDEVLEVLRQDLAEGQYFVTGNLTREIFADDCRCEV